MERVNFLSHFFFLQLMKSEESLIRFDCRKSSKKNARYTTVETTKRLICKWPRFRMGSGDLKSESPAMWKPDKWLPFCQKKHLKSRQKRSDFEWFGFQLVGAIAFIMSGFQMFLDFKWLDFRSPLYSNGLGIQMVCIRTHTHRS